jgi:hypothetical protein
MFWAVVARSFVAPMVLIRSLGSDLDVERDLPVGFVLRNALAILGAIDWHVRDAGSGKLGEGEELCDIGLIPAAAALDDRNDAAAGSVAWPVIGFAESDTAHEFSFGTAALGCLI